MHGIDQTYRHFSRIASRYRRLRRTDESPIHIIAARLSRVRPRLAADVGCGAGRYDWRLLQRLNQDMRLLCVDFNDRMLRHLCVFLRRQGLSRFLALRAAAESLPIPDESLDCLFTFNAIHHFERERFFRELERVLHPGGIAFLYTRFRSQNRRNIWGRYFPDFARKETRLYERTELVASIEARPTLRLESLQYFLYHRRADLPTLLKRAEHHCYSTFAMYSPEEFGRALAEFERQLISHFPDPSDIRWIDENVMAIVRKSGA